MAAAMTRALVIDLGSRRLGHERMRAVSTNDQGGPFLDRFAIFVATDDTHHTALIVAQ